MHIRVCSFVRETNDTYLIILMFQPSKLPQQSTRTASYMHWNWIRIYRSKFITAYVSQHLYLQQRLYLHLHLYLHLYQCPHLRLYLCFCLCINLCICAVHVFVSSALPVSAYVAACTSVSCTSVSVYVSLYVSLCACLCVCLYASLYVSLHVCFSVGIAA